MQPAVIEATRSTTAKAKDRSPAAEIVQGLRNDGLLPFRVSLTVEEALPLAMYLRDCHAAWGSSGALAPPDLQSEPCFAPKSKARQPRTNTQAQERVSRARSQMRDHELYILQWIETARSKHNITLASAGMDWMPMAYSDPKLYAAAATGMIKSVCRTIAVVYKFPIHHVHYPPSR